MTTVFVISTSASAGRELTGGAGTRWELSGATAFPGPLGADKSLGLGCAAGHPQLQGEKLVETMRNLRRRFKLRWVTAVFGDTFVL